MSSYYNAQENDRKIELMDYAARWLSLKPELLGGVETDRQLISRLDGFAKAIHGYLNEENLPPRPGE